MPSISGFPEWLPAQQHLFNHWKGLLAHHFEQFCYSPMDTPVVERMSTLLSKGDDSEIYTLGRWADSVLTQRQDKGATDQQTVNEREQARRAERQLGLRFDLTIPLARYVTDHHGVLTFPYRRYHIAPVWRGERPQEGRFRQFYQCDIDVIGQETLSIHYDSDILFTLHSAINALPIESVLGPMDWHINHRCVLTSWAHYAGISDVDAALRLIDKCEKIGLEAILSPLKELHASAESLDILHTWFHDSSPANERIDRLQSLNWPHTFHESLDQLGKTIQRLCLRGMDTNRIHFSPLLARGLSYYSGITFEAKLPQHGDLGSICAGGRYDHLASMLSSKSIFPGVGASLGLSRLFARFIEQNVPAVSSGDLLIAVQDAHHLEDSIQLGDTLRALGWRVEVFLGKAPLKNQLNYAHRKGFPFVLFANAQEWQSRCIQFKSMHSGQQNLVPISDLPSVITEQMAYRPSDGATNL